MTWELPSANDFDYARFIRENAATYGDDVVLYVVPFSTYGASACDECLIASNHESAVDTFNAYGIGTDSADLFSFHGMLTVNLYRANSDGERLQENGFTDAAIVAFSILDALSDYPLLDDSDFSEREYNAWESALSDELRRSANDYLDDSESDIEVITDIAYEVYAESNYNSICPDDVGNTDDIYRLARDKYFGDRAHSILNAQIEGQEAFNV